ncbi:MAG: hypothetical protein LC641_01515 [Spirochaeta sp.]|nr:hypothetical protein [Spirochaeta sp.]
MLKRHHGVIAVALLGILTVFSPYVSAQEFSERKQVAVFQLSYYGEPRDPVPQSQTYIRIGNVFAYSKTVESETTEIFQQAVGAIDEQIRSVFINMGRFDVIGLTQRMQESNVDAFVNALRQYREDTLEIPEAVLIGEQAFTEQDFERLVGGFVLVIPSVSFYNLERRDSEQDYQATIETSFTFVNVEDFSTIGQFFVETSGTDENAVTAMRRAVNGIPAQLEFRVRSMPIFQIRTGVLEIAGRSIILEFGQNMGLQKGDEYAVVQQRRTSTGHTTQDETGLLVVEEVREEFSIGRLLYAKPDVVIGDQLQEVPRMGADFTPYANLLLNFENQEPELMLFGARITASRGYFQWRPLVGLEIPTTTTLFGFLFPMNVYVGGESNFYLGRLKLHPSFGIGVGGAVPVDDTLFEDDFYTTHFGGSLRLTASYLISRDTMIFLETGVAGWQGFYDRDWSNSTLNRFFGSYGGIQCAMQL